MALLDLLPWRRKSSGSVYERWLQLLADQISTKSGRSIGIDAAMGVSAWMAGARVLADGIALPPLKLMRAQDRSRKEAADHPLYKLLLRKPSQFQTAYEFRESMMLHLVFIGAAYVSVGYFRDQPAELVLLTPGDMVVTRDDAGVLHYRWKNQSLPDGSVWHIRGPSWNTWQGLETVRLAREALGLSVAIEESQANFYANGARPTGIVSVEGSLNEKQYAEMRAWINKEIASNPGGVVIADRAAKLSTLAMSGVDLQLIETRKFQLEEMCRHLRLMPIMVGYSDKASTYASAVEMFVQHVRGSLAPWFERIEQSADCSLLTDKELDDGYYTHFVEEALTRGSPDQTHKMIRDDMNAGLITPNEGREFLDLNPMAGVENDELRVPANIVGQPDKPQPDAKPPGG